MQFSTVSEFSEGSYHCHLYHLSSRRNCLRKNMDVFCVLKTTLKVCGAT